MKHLFAAIFFGVILFATGCASNRIHAEFYDVVRSHKDLTVETMDAVAASIQEELDERKDLTPEQQQSICDLIDRLNFIKEQAIIMDKYVETNQVDQQLLSELLRLRWNNPQGTSKPSGQQ
jgi:hypothetical protein